MPPTTLAGVGRPSSGGTSVLDRHARIANRGLTASTTSSNNIHANRQRHNRTRNSTSASSYANGGPLTRSRASREGNTTPPSRNRSSGSASTSAITPVTPSITITTNDGSSLSNIRVDSGMQVFITLPQSQDHQVTDGSSAASSPLPRPLVSLPARMGPLNCLLDIEREYLESLSSRLRLRLYVGLARSGEGKFLAVTDDNSNNATNIFWPRLAQLFDDHDWRRKFIRLLKAKEYDAEVCIKSKLRLDQGRPSPMYVGESFNACDQCVQHRLVCARLIYHNKKVRLCIAALPLQIRKGTFRENTYYLRPRPRSM